MDDRGIVIFMVDEKMSPAVGKQLLKVRRPQQAACSLTPVLSALINELPEEDRTYGSMWKALVCMWLLSRVLMPLTGTNLSSCRAQLTLSTAPSTSPTTWCSTCCGWRRSTPSTCWRSPSTSSSTTGPCRAWWRVSPPPHSPPLSRIFL